MKKNYLIIGSIAFIILIAVITNPNDDKHKSSVKSKLLSLTLQKSVNNIANETGNQFYQAGLGIGTMIGGALAEQLINNSVSTDNYLIFSTTKITWNGETKIIGFGAFGNVYLSDKIDEA